MEGPGGGVHRFVLLAGGEAGTATQKMESREKRRRWEVKERGNRRGEWARKPAEGARKMFRGSWKFHNQSGGGANQAQADVDKRAEGGRRRKPDKERREQRADGQTSRTMKRRASFRGGHGS